MMEEALLLKASEYAVQLINEVSVYSGLSWSGTIVNSAHVQPYI
jgi:hypothetical protein